MSSKIILNRLKIVLLENNVTGRQLAIDLNKSESTVSLWCSNQKQPSLLTFYEIALYLDVDLPDLFVSTKKMGYKNKRNYTNEQS